MPADHPEPLHDSVVDEVDLEELLPGDDRPAFLDENRVRLRPRIARG